MDGWKLDVLSNQPIVTYVRRSVDVFEGWCLLNLDLGEDPEVYIRVGQDHQGPGESRGEGTL